MLYIIFAILLLATVGKLIGLAARLAWGVFKIGFRIVLLPIILIAMALKGLIVFALFLVIIGALLAFLVPVKH